MVLIVALVLVAVVARAIHGHAALVVGGLATVTVVLSVVGYFVFHAFRRVQRGDAVPLRGGLVAAAFLLAFPEFIAGVASGGTWSNPSPTSQGWVPSLIWQSRGLFVDVVPLTVGVLPHVLGRRVPWEIATDRIRHLVPAWLAAVAAVDTACAVLICHYGHGVLATAKLGVVLAGGVGTALLLLPFYLACARSFWRVGYETLLSPAYWVRTFREVRTEYLRLARVGQGRERVTE